MGDAITEADYERLRNLQWSDVQDENGNDVTLIDDRLSMTPAERLRRNDEAVRGMQLLREAGACHYDSGQRRTADAAE